MSRTKRPYPKALRDLMADKSRILSQAQALADLGMGETARPLWESAAVFEERIAPLLEVVGRHREAALHRASAASCYHKTGELTHAANLYRAALAGPIADHTRQELEKMLAGCLAKLAQASRKTA